MDYSSLPFADGDLPLRITEPICFHLKKDGRAVTLLPVHDPQVVPKGLIETLREEFNFVIEEGLTYPHHQKMDHHQFVHYWFHSFAAILLEGTYSGWKQVPDGNWSELFLGTFYVKPNYLGRCSHVCNAGFVVAHSKRGLGLGRELGAKYLVWGPQLGYAYSVFNLVFETNVASMRIWDSLGFERIGYVKNVAALRGVDGLVGAYMYGKDLTEEQRRNEEMKKQEKK